VLCVSSYLQPKKEEEKTGDKKLAKYEAVFILDPRKIEGNGEAFSGTIEAEIKKIGGEITRIKCLEKKVFARPIGKHNAGVYWDYIVDSDAEFVEKLNEKYQLNSSVLRLAVFHYVDGQDDDIFKPREERLFKAENFQDDMFGDDRSYRYNKR